MEAQSPLANAFFPPSLQPKRFLGEIQEKNGSEVGRSEKSIPPIHQAELTPTHSYGVIGTAPFLRDRAIGR